MSRTIFIGDLHGCIDEARALLVKLDVQPTDWVIFLGDLVDRGPSNDECVNLARHREQVQGRSSCILGNHEEQHLRYLELEAMGALNPHKMPPTHVATRAQLRPEHLDWFKTLPLYVRVPEHGTVAVHAGCFPGRTVEQQKPCHLLHVQTIRPWSFDEDGNMVPNEASVWPSRVPKGEDGWRFWTHFWDGPERVVFGHSVLTRPLVTDKVVGIDGGAVFGLALHAYVLPEGRIVSVQAKRDYGRGKRGRGDAAIRTFLVHDDVGTYS